VRWIEVGGPKGEDRVEKDKRPGGRIARTGFQGKTEEVGNFNEQGLWMDGLRRGRMMEGGASKKGGLDERARVVERVRRWKRGEKRGKRGWDYGEAELTMGVDGRERSKGG
jgi:hypothetical protein